VSAAGMTFVCEVGGKKKGNLNYIDCCRGLKSTPNKMNESLDAQNEIKTNREKE